MENESVSGHEAQKRLTEKTNGKSNNFQTGGQTNLANQQTKTSITIQVIGLNCYMASHKLNATQLILDLLGGNAMGNDEHRVQKSLSCL